MAYFMWDFCIIHWEEYNIFEGFPDKFFFPLHILVFEYLVQTTELHPSASKILLFVFKQRIKWINCPLLWPPQNDECWKALVNKQNIKARCHKIRIKSERGLECSAVSQLCSFLPALPLLHDFYLLSCPVFQKMTMFQTHKQISPFALSQACLNLFGILSSFTFCGEHA